jgi:hypothetical protein
MRSSPRRCTAHDVEFDLFDTKDVEGEVEEGAYSDGAVELGELGEEAGEEGTGEKGAVASIWTVAGTDCRREFRSRLGEAEGASRKLKNISEGVDKEKATYGIFEETGVGRRLG